MMPATRAVPAQADDAALIAALARGDRAALGQLYDVHAPVMLALAQRIVGARSAAEDLVHDVLLEAWQHAAEYDASRGSVRAWLMLRTRSRALDLVKSARVARSVSLSDSVLELGSEDEAIALSPDRRAVQKLVAGLPEEQRTVLLLGYFEGLSSSEIAARIRVPVGTVKSRVASALTRLRAALTQEGMFP
jgi:RNA polymerase sigma-70 factor (ECF subfamily)